MDEDARRRAREICKLIGGADCIDEAKPCCGSDCYIMELVELGRADAEAEIGAKFQLTPL